MSDKKTKSGGRVLLIFLIISLLINGFLLLDKFIQKDKTERYIHELTQTQFSKDSLTNEFSKLYDEYDLLETNNDTLNSKLKVEQEKINKLLEEIKKEKIGNVRAIAKYKKELATLRQVMRSFIVQIDSLNTMNQKLVAENEEIKSYYEDEQGKNRELSEKNENLNKTVEKAAEIKAFAIKIVGLTNRDKETFKTKKVNKIEVCCQLSENELAHKGNRYIYIRIARPDGIILSKSETNLFNYQGDQIIYTARRKVEYTGKRVPLCIYWINDEILINGRYNINIFDGGRKIGSSSIELK